MNTDEAKELIRLKERVYDSLFFHTRYFFKKRFKRKFVVGKHHPEICDKLEKVYTGEIKKLIINIAPRYSKTELAVKNFISHSIGINPAAKFIHLSYSDSLALDNSEDIKSMVQTAEYQQFFKVKIKKDSQSKKKWYTTEGGGLYATSSSGQVTGFGAGSVDEEEDFEEFMSGIEAYKDKRKFGGAIIIDDPIKPDDADSAVIRNKVNQKFDTTIRNRVNSRNTPIIIIMQRLHPDDLCGFLMKKEDDWHVLSLPCITEVNGEREALWEFKHTLEELDKIRKVNTVVFDRQYQQNPKPLEGLLYTSFKTYQELRFTPGIVKAYIDTADTGKDFLCSIVYTIYAGMIYILDVIYTQKPNEDTEPMVAEQMERFKVNYVDIESNAGGRAFARNVERLCRERGNFRTTVNWFYQSKNKDARIKSNSSTVQNQILFPHDWAYRWEQYHNAMTTYMAAGGNDHDDAPDATTGVVEKSEDQATVTWE